MGSLCENTNVNKSFDGEFQSTEGARSELKQKEFSSNRLIRNPKADEIIDHLQTENQRFQTENEVLKTELERLSADIIRKQESNGREKSEVCNKNKEGISIPQYEQSKIKICVPSS